MVVMIRLARPGRAVKKHPFFRINVVDAKRARDSRCIENVGYYDPRPEPAVVSFRKERVEYWLSCGAKMTTTVRSLFRKYLKQAAK